MTHKYFAYCYHCPVEGLMMYGEECSCENVDEEE